ncbi:MAG: ATP-binding cassette domain-containing protein [Chloroflexi bacterium]|nr:MAG: ATP-binding cassette domain-containing protein [Chloroflexota bacterium]
MAIKIEGLTFTYAAGSKPALSDINLEIKRGEYLGIMGLNGAGKTTLGLSINGIVPQSTMGFYEGKVTVEGLDTSTTPVREMARTVGIVFDNPEFQMSQVSAAEEVALGLENLGVPTEEMPPRVSAALATVGLPGFEERSPMGLSGGQQQRLAIASVLAMHPRILFMDEPTSNLDPIGKEEVFELARKLNREDGLTVIVAEHECEVLAAYADRIVVLNEGKIVMIGTPSEVFARGDELAKLGLRVPQATELALDLGGSDKKNLPVTTEEAVKWVEAR